MLLSGQSPRLVSKLVSVVTKRPLLLSAVLLTVGGIGDVLTTAEVPFTLVYLAPIAIAAWYRGRRAGLAFSAASLPFTLYTRLEAGPDARPLILAWTLLAEITIFVVFSEMVKRIRSLVDEETRLRVAAAESLEEAQRANEEERRLALEAEQLNLKMLHMQKLESLGVLASGIAHDFNNLLTIILMNGELLHLLLAAPSPEWSAVQEVIGAAKRASYLTKQMLAYAGKGRHTLERVDLSSQVRDIAMLLGASAPKTVAIRLQFEAEKLPAIEVDVAQLQQLVMNLVINAVEAIGTDVPGAVLVTTGAESVAEGSALDATGQTISPGQYVFVEVEDTGAGIPDDIRARIFDPFFTSKLAGRGLGLSAVLGIVKAHGGALQLVSAVGRGTRFHALFPAHALPVEPAVNTPNVERALTGLALVVDDESGVRRAARHVLERAGLTVLEAANGALALEIVRRHTDDVVLVLMDVNMPVMGGQEAFRAMRALSSRPKVVLMSGDDIGAFADQPGLAGVLPKPFTPKQLLGLVVSILVAAFG